MTKGRNPDMNRFGDEATAYRDIPFDHEHDSVCHSRLEFVVGDAHTNTIESFWAKIKRSCAGTNHSWSQKHIHRYFAEFCARNDLRKLGVLEKMEIIAAKMVGKTLTYKKLVEKNGLPSGSRPLSSDGEKQLSLRWGCWRGFPSKRSVHERRKSYE